MDKTFVEKLLWGMLRGGLIVQLASISESWRPGPIKDALQPLPLYKVCMNFINHISEELDPDSSLWPPSFEAPTLPLG